MQVDAERRKTQASLDNALAESNLISKKIGELMKAGKKEEATAAKNQTAELKSQSKTLGESLAQLEDDLKNLLYNIPNVPHETVPEGGGADDNENIYEWGTIPELQGEPMPHWDLIKKYDIVDFELGIKIAGAGFPVYKGKGARLQRALISYFLDKNMGAGYTEYQMPLMVNEASGYGTGQLPDKEGQMYHVTEDDLYLIPTAEVPLADKLKEIAKEQNLDVAIAYVEGDDLRARAEELGWNGANAASTPTCPPQKKPQT